MWFNGLAQMDSIIWIWKCLWSDMVQVGKKDNVFNHFFRRYVYDEHFAYQEAEGVSLIK